MKPDTMKMRIKAAAAAAVLGLSLFGALPAAASTKVAAEPRVLTQATATQKGSLTIEVAANDSYTHTTTPLISAGVTVSKIATLDDKATNKYSLLPAYADLEKTYRTEAKVTKTNIFDQMTASQSNTLASLLAKRAASAGSTRTTDKNGRAEFSPLDEGIFLVQQTQAVKGYKSFEPFLVCVPLKEDGAWNYTVTADPKTAPEKESETQTETQPETKPSKPSKPSSPSNPPAPGTPSNVKTGDTSPLTTYAGMLIIAGIAIVGIVMERRRKRS